jgi:hypothetical protein
VKRDPRWRITDLVDFEFLVAGDSDESRLQRSCERFQAERLPALREAGPLSRQGVFRAWLDVYQDTAAKRLPGDYLTSGYSLIVVLSILVGIGLGGSFTGALLFYHGDVPVNVAWFLACTLGVQMVILLVALVFWAIRATTSFLDDFHPLRTLLAGMVSLLSAGLRKMPGEERDRLLSVFAKVARRREIYGSLSTWPLVVITQIFGVSFNIGILAVMLAQISFKDIEFGWQSSFVQSDETAYRLAEGVATPWKWFAPNAHPTLEEVKESHFTFEERRSNKSWWPFLCYSVVCYGLLLRTGLLVFALVKWRLAMRKLTFDHEGCRSLYRRLVGPAMHAENDAAALVIPAASGEEGAAHRTSSGEAFALIASEIEIREDRLGGYLSRKFGWRLTGQQRAEIDHPSANAGSVAALASKRDGLSSVVIVIPAKRAPIKAIAIFVRMVAEAIGARPELVLLLVGRSEEAGFAPVDANELTYWKNFVAINRLHVSIEVWKSE